MDLARAVARLLPTEGYGLYHLTSAGQCTWYEFACAIFAEAGLHPDVKPVTSDQFPVKAKRPDYSVLDNQRFRAEGFADMRPWQEALSEYVRGRASATLR
jgi:dTDP-4-dehydrorhamnose reductase